ncbi:MAG: hypothetical protein HEQ39_05720 [Rhizobacter sp.]
MRKVKITVDGKPTGQQRTWAYPSGISLGRFWVPIYDCHVEGTDAVGKSVREHFSVLRFGVQSKDGKTARVVGLADFQMHVIKSWIPSYQVHSANSPENGAWQVFDNFLIHDGPDNETELFATIGCIEIMGPKGFIRFNDLLISLSGPTAKTRPEQLTEIGAAKNISITYQKAERPSLSKVL